MLKFLVVEEDNRMVMLESNQPVVALAFFIAYNEYNRNKQESNQVAFLAQELYMKDEYTIPLIKMADFIALHLEVIKTMKRRRTQLAYIKENIDNDGFYQEHSQDYVKHLHREKLEPWEYYYDEFVEDYIDKE